MRILKAKSGLTILFRPMNSGLVSMKYVVRCGPVDELRPEEAGLCHALEHMLFGGTEKRDWSEIVHDWGQVGTYADANTHHDRTNYFVTCLKKHWQESYEVLTDIMYNSVFPEERWEEIEKGAIVSEIQGYEDDPASKLDEEIYRHALGPRYHSIWGNVKIIKQATMADLKSFYDRYYCGDNILLTVAGDLTETQVLRVVNKYDKRRPQKPPKREKLVFDFNYRPVSRTKKQLEQVVVQLLKPLKLPRDPRGRVALDLVTERLSQHLFEELRDERGLCYEAEAELYYDIPEHLFLNIKTATDKERFGETKRALHRALKNFPDKGLTIDKLTNMKMAGLFSATEAKERTSSATTWMWDGWQEKLREDPFEAFSNILETMSDSTIRGTAKSILSGRIKFGKVSEKI